MSRPRPPAAMRLSASRKGDKGPDGASALSAALEQAPGLAGEGVSCSIEVDCSPVRTKEVERKTLDPQADRFEGRLVGFAYRQVDVRVRVNARCLTPVGKAVLSGGGRVERAASWSSRRGRTVSVDADTEVGHGPR